MVAQQHGQRRRDRPEQQERQGQAQGPLLPDSGKRGRQAPERGSAGQHQVQPLERQHAAERDDEGVDPQRHAQPGVEKPGQGGHGQRDENRRGNRRPRTEHQRRRDRGERQHGAHRQVDAPGHDHERHPERHEGLEQEAHRHHLGVGRRREIAIRRRHAARQQQDAGDERERLRLQPAEPRRPHGPSLVPPSPRSLRARSRDGPCGIRPRAGSVRAPRAGRRRSG